MYVIFMGEKMSFYKITNKTIKTVQVNAFQDFTRPISTSTPVTERSDNIVLGHKKQRYVSDTFGKKAKSYAIYLFLQPRLNVDVLCDIQKQKH